VDPDPVAGADAGARQMVGELVGSCLELGVGATGVAGDDGYPVRTMVGDDLEEVGQVEATVPHQGNS
jgi:hypothetical protein